MLPSIQTWAGVKAVLLEYLNQCTPKAGKRAPEAICAHREGIRLARQLIELEEFEEVIRERQKEEKRIEAEMYRDNLPAKFREYAVYRTVTQQLIYIHDHYVAYMALRDPIYASGPRALSCRALERVREIISEKSWEDDPCLVFAA
jgi:hypothetical protein